jgi:LacI family transcriptional regulator
MDPEPTGSPTMRDLAAALNISPTTVSLALRNHARVALETRHRVQAYARDRGYQLNPAVTSLMSRVRSSQRAHYHETLGWISFWIPDRLTDAVCGAEYQRSLWQGACARAREFGYTLDCFCLAEPGMSGRRLGGILAARGIRGVLIPPLPKACGHLRIGWENFSAVALSHTLAWPQLHKVVPDHHNNMHMILRQLRHRGYQRPGMLLAQKFDERSQNRLRAAFYFYQQSLPARRRVPVLLCPLAGYEKSCAAWLKKYRPDAVITLGHYRHLREMAAGNAGYSRNLGVILLGYGASDSGFTAVDENPVQIGATAVDQLSAQLNRNERGIAALPHSTFIKGSWVEGATLPSLRDFLTA